MSLAVTLVALSGGNAFADDAHDGFFGDHWEASVGVQGAISMDIGPIEAHEPAGLQITAGRQLGSFRLAGDFSLLSFSGCIGPEDVEGQIHRLGASARYRLSMTGDQDVFGGPAFMGASVYVGGGLGRQSIRYVGGGHSARTDAMLELGMEIAGGLKHIAGIDVGVRVLGAGRPPIPVEVPHGSMEFVEDHTTDIAVFGTMSILLGR